jgi:hypothetical protein
MFFTGSKSSTHATLWSRSPSPYELSATSGTFSQAPPSELAGAADSQVGAFVSSLSDPRCSLKESTLSGTKLAGAADFEWGTPAEIQRSFV